MNKQIKKKNKLNERNQIEKKVEEEKSKQVQSTHQNEAIIEDLDQESDGSYDYDKISQTNQKQIEEMGTAEIIVLSYDRQKILIGNSYGRIIILDVKDFSFIDSFKSQTNKPIKLLSGNGNMIVSVDDNNFVTLYNIEKKTIVPSDIDEKVKNQKIMRMKISRYSNHFVLQTTKEIILLDYPKYDQIQTI